MRRPGAQSLSPVAKHMSKRLTQKPLMPTSLMLLPRREGSVRVPANPNAFDGTHANSRLLNSLSTLQAVIRYGDQSALDW